MLKFNPMTTMYKLLEWNVLDLCETSRTIPKKSTLESTLARVFFSFVLFVRVARLPVMNSFLLILLFQTRSRLAWQIAEGERMILQKDHSIN